MTSEADKADLVYDRLIAAEKLKRGTKYERLAAIAFAQLEGRAAVHDLRLRGSSGVRHQIDVTLGPDHKRVLIECKNHDKKVGLGIVRDFFGVVEDVRPDDAWVVTAVGFTRDAVTYAKGKEIKLAILRTTRPGDLDRANVVKRARVTIQPISLSITRTEWTIDESDPGSLVQAERPGELVWTNEAKLVRPDGTTRTVHEFIDDELDRREAYEGEAGPRLGEHAFSEPQTLVLPDGSRARVTGIRWTGLLSRGEHSFDVGFGVGGLVAELTLLTASGEILGIMSNRQIARFNVVQGGRYEVEP